MNREVLHNQNQTVDIEKIEDILSFVRVGLDRDDAEALACNTTPAERAAAKDVYRFNPPVTPPPADMELIKRSPTYRAYVTGITSLDTQSNSTDPLTGRPRS